MNHFFREIYLTLSVAIFSLTTVFGQTQSQSLGVSSHPEGNADQHYVIILSLDGYRHDLKDVAYTPTLDSLAKCGVYSSIYPVFPANTFPSHYSMATGLHPDHHGVVNNVFYDKKSNHYLSVFNKENTTHEGFWGGEPIWNTAERQGQLAHIFMWPGSDVPINGRQATIWTPYSSHPTMYERADWVVNSMCRPIEEIPNLVMWYFHEPDLSEHFQGVNSKATIEKAEMIDRALRYFFYKIRQSPVYDKINFIITSDHGMTDLSKNRMINLYRKLDESKVIRSVRGTPFGLEVEEDYKQEALKIIRKTGHIQAWEREKMPEKYHYGTHETRLSNLILLPDLGWSIDYRKEKRPLKKIATHGFDPFLPEMHMIFYATGPAFKKNYRQEEFQNLNVYLILCHLLGIEPAPNDCNWEDIKEMFR